MEIKSDEAIELVYQTMNYSKFSSVDFNRDVKESRYEKIKASFEEREILNPIIVNEKFQIIDGQGRFEVCKALHRPVKYIIAKGATINDCRRMNHYNMPWSNDDFIDSYAKAGYEQYVKLKRAHDLTGLGYSTISDLILTQKGEISTGKLIVTDIQENLLYCIVEHAKELKEALSFPGKIPTKFYRA